MGWLVAAFCIAGYLFAWAAVAGFYDQMHKDKDDGLDGFGFLIGAAWPMYIAWLPFRSVYRAVKVQMLAQVKRAKKAAEPSVPLGKFRLNCCETCAYGLTGDAKKMRYCGLKKKWVGNGEWCTAYK